MKYIIASEKMLLESECCVYPIKETWLGGGTFNSSGQLQVFGLNNGGGGDNTLTTLSS